MTKALVCGGRDYKNYLYLFNQLNLLQRKYDITTIIHGGASGADTLAGRFAIQAKLKEIVFEAKWKQYGPGAGPKRNQQMLEEGQPDLVVAFPGNRGTNDMVTRAKKAGVPIIDLRMSNA